MATQTHTLYPDRYVEISDKSGSFLVESGIAYFTEQTSLPSNDAPVMAIEPRLSNKPIKVNSGEKLYAKSGTNKNSRISYSPVG